MLTGAVLAAESGVFARVGTPGDLNTEGLFYDGTKYGGTWTYSTDRRLPLADIPQASQEAARTSTEDLQFPDMAAADAFLGGGVLPRSAQQEARERGQVSIEAQCDQQGQLVRMYIRTAYCDELQNPDGGIRYGDYMHVWMYVLTDVTPEDLFSGTTGQPGAAGGLQGPGRRQGVYFPGDHTRLWQPLSGAVL